MKYIIASKHIIEGIIGQDTSNLQQYTELGWETMYTRLRIIDLLNSGQIGKNDIIVTHTDRKCFYSKIFNNVADHFPDQPNDAIDVISEVGQNNDGCSLINYHPRLKNWDRDLPTILNVDYTDPFEPDTDIIGISCRLRDHNKRNNVDIEYWKDLIKHAASCGIKSYIFGKGAEELCDNINSFHVGLQGWCTAMHNPRCRFIIGPMTGAMVVGQVCCNSKMIIIDHGRIMHPGISNHPMYFGKCVHFSKATIEFVNKNPDCKTLI